MQPGPREDGASPAGTDQGTVAAQTHPTSGGTANTVIDATRSRGRWPWHRTLTVAGWLLLAATLGVIAWRIVSAPTTVKTVRPDRGELVAEVYGTGTLESKVMVSVSSKITGKVVAVSVDQGDMVTAGEALARLEATDFEDAVRDAAALREQAEAIVANAKVDLDRQRVLFAGEVITRAELDASETAYRVADAQLRSAGANLGVAQAKLADTHIVSPASGVVATRNLEVGSTVVPGSPIFRIAASVPWVVAQVDERATGELRLGQPVRIVFETAPSRAMIGRVARLATEVDRVTEEREVDVELDHPPHNWFLGQVTDVYIEIARKNIALRVPLTALVARGGLTGVFAVVDGRARWRPVQLGLRGRTLVEVVNGVSMRDDLVASPLVGKTPIVDGARVAFARAGGAP